MDIENIYISAVADSIMTQVNENRRKLDDDMEAEDVIVGSLIGVIVDKILDKLKEQGVEVKREEIVEYL